MKPLIVYITRPTAYEVYMGGKRHLNLWLQEPHYDHRPMSNGDGQYVDRGWTAAHCSPEPARLLLNQDDDLLDLVMEHVVTSLYPLGMRAEEGIFWSERLDSERDPGWRSLFKDAEWEGKCNLCMKRFLLKVDLRNSTVEKVKPGVVVRDSYVETTDITFELATRRYHDPNSIDIIPF